MLDFIFKAFIPYDMIVSCDQDLVSSFSNNLNSKDLNSLLVDNTIFPIEESFVIMSNHQAYTDWVYLWSVLRVQNLEGSIKIILKESLKNVPIIGWGMQYFDFIFLKRNWNADKETLEAHMRKINNCEFPTSLLLFPEGTTFTKNTLTKSLAFAAKSDLKIQHPKHLILPRSTGIKCCLDNLSLGKTKYLYDVTVGYSGVPRDGFAEDVYSIKNIFYNEKYPKQIHINIRRFLISDIPLDEDSKFSEWLQNRFLEKDSKLDYFYKSGDFHSENDIPYMKNHISTLDKVFGIRDMLLAAVLIYFFIKIF
ncbi:putative acyltransferase [Smittium culicis]|uniref:Putative acyltransferase n=1 Tax=Smittium culicis TaxID=133412 RepID=A0A1R1Y6G3_9FUNG|nr:putative acyltransferase [Smittium culicis]